MSIFGWIAPGCEPPADLDLRHEGWVLCGSAAEAMPRCPYVLLIDGRGLDSPARRSRAEQNRPLSRVVVYGVEEGTERAELLALGCGEALSSSVGRRELATRARRVAEQIGTMPRRRLMGSLTLDLFHRDARSGRRWLRLHPREFSVLWRLADDPGEVVTRGQLLREVWRISQEPETNSVEVHISRLRTKLAAAGCPGLIETVAEGGYCIAGGFAREREPAGYSAPTASPSRSRNR